MIVEPDFLDHWKTRLLVELLGQNEASPLCVIRLWAHCQHRKQWEFDNLSNPALKAICRFTGDAEALTNALLESGFIKVENGVLIVHGWAETNASLVRSWTVGKLGGRPKKQTQQKPSDNLAETYEKPSDNLAKTYEKPIEKIDKIDKIDKKKIQKKESGEGRFGFSENQKRIIRCISPNCKFTRTRDPSEQRAWQNLASKISDDEVEIIEWFYQLPKSEECDETWNRKKGVAQLLNQWTSQVEFAKEMKQTIKKPKKSSHSNKTLGTTYGMEGF